MSTPDAYTQLISTNNLFSAWKTFRKGKRSKWDVLKFERHLEDNLFELQSELQTKTYRHSGYHSFYIQDPKRRHIHKPKVRDRIVHQLLYDYLYRMHDKGFIFDSYSCRIQKGTHKAVKRLITFVGRGSRNYTRPCWCVKCDIAKFFANVDHEVLHGILNRKISNTSILWLTRQVVDSFHTENKQGKGLPLGNLTSQIFANIYMNELDQHVKHHLKVKYFIRYADDFILVSHDRVYLEKQIEPMRQFLSHTLKLTMHPDKIIFRNLNWGIDFLGYIILPHYILPRTKTRIRIFKKIALRVKEYKSGTISELQLYQCAQSYLGYLSHANAYTLSREIKNYLWFLLSDDGV